MARIVDSLKNFYKKQGGTPSDVRGIKSISGVIDKIANLSLGGGGGNNDFVVTYTDNGGTITANKECADIISAIEAGKNVIAKFTTNGLPDKYFQLTQYTNTANLKLVDYSILTTNVDATKAVALYISHANTGESDMVVSRSLELGAFN